MDTESLMFEMRQQEVDRAVKKAGAGGTAAGEKTGGLPMNHEL